MTDSIPLLTLDARQQYYVMRLSEWTRLPPQEILELIFEKGLIRPDEEVGFPFTLVTTEDEVRVLLMTWLRESKPALARVVDQHGHDRVLDGGHAVRLVETWFNWVSMADYWIYAHVGAHVAVAAEHGSHEEVAVVSLSVPVISVSPVMEPKEEDRLVVIDDDDEDVETKLIHLDWRSGLSPSSIPLRGMNGQNVDQGN